VFVSFLFYVRDAIRQYQNISTMKHYRQVFHSNNYNLHLLNILIIRCNYNILYQSAP